MLKNLIVLPDGTEVSSGSQGPSIQQLTLTRTVNNGTELTLGSACAAMLETTLFLPPEIPLAQGDALLLYQVDEEETRHSMGIFLAQKPERLGAQRRRITAYDRMVLFDVDITQWVAELTDWPYSLDQLTAMLCDYCGVPLATKGLPNGAFPVQPFTVQDCTARQLLQWIGEATGRFCRIDPLGQLEFAWYVPAEGEVGTAKSQAVEAVWLGENLTLEGEPAWEEDGLQLTMENVSVAETAEGFRLVGQQNRWYFQGSLSLEDYAVEPVTRVQIQGTGEDVGTFWPEEAEAENTYTVTANPLLAALSAQTLKAVAATLYEQLRQVSYTPCKLSLPAEPTLEPGQILCLKDTNGRQAQVYIMSEVRKGQRSQLESTGSARRNSTTAVNNRSFRTLAGKMLELRTDVDGLKAENRDAQGKLAAIDLDLEGIRTRVESVDETQKQLSTQINQTADSVSIFINRMETEGVGQVKTRNGYTFSDQGLQIQRTGESVQSMLSHQGLEVTRNGQTLLQADQEGVSAVDVTVGNYLILGSHARLEDYPGQRTACYYL